MMTAEEFHPEWQSNLLFWAMFSRSKQVVGCSRFSSLRILLLLNPCRDSGWRPNFYWNFHSLSPPQTFWINIFSPLLWFTQTTCLHWQKLQVFEIVGQKNRAKSLCLLSQSKVQKYRRNSTQVIGNDLKAVSMWQMKPSRSRNLCWQLSLSVYAESEPRSNENKLKLNIQLNQLVLTQTTRDSRLQMEETFPCKYLQPSPS